MIFFIIVVVRSNVIARDVIARDVIARRNRSNPRSNPRGNWCQLWKLVSVMLNSY